MARRGNDRHVANEQGSHGNLISKTDGSEAFVQNVTPAETGDPVAKLSDAPRAEQGETVLVVDDEPTVRMLVTEVLEELGYTAIEATDGRPG